jgi:hypothetical protein
MKTLMSPALNEAAAVVTFANIRLEYLDRFRFEGDASVADPKLVLRLGSPLIAPHIFDRTDFWHCPYRCIRRILPTFEASATDHDRRDRPTSSAAYRPARSMDKHYDGP